MFKYCPNCGFQLESKNKFCPKCGKNLNATTTNNLVTPDFSNATTSDANSKNLQTTNINQTTISPSSIKQKSKMPLIIIIVVILVAVVALAAFLLFSNISNSSQSQVLTKMEPKDNAENIRQNGVGINGFLQLTYDEEGVLSSCESSDIDADYKDITSDGLSSKIVYTGIDNGGCSELSGDPQKDNKGRIISFQYAITDNATSGLNGQISYTFSYFDNDNFENIEIEYKPNDSRGHHYKTFKFNESGYLTCVEFRTRDSTSTANYEYNCKEGAPDTITEKIIYKDHGYTEQQGQFIDIALSYDKGNKDYPSSIQAVVNDGSSSRQINEALTYAKV
ncbi:MAG: zinc ribbon domain-containing protein, partial [Coriobacteriales bacterium]|nr:zinc ribbon domain-containing protein [Coriobacteriales bacterium]